MRWWSAFWGLLLLLFAVAFARGWGGAWHVSTTDDNGNETSEYRELRFREKLGLGCVVVVAGAFGCLLLAGAIPWTDERVPDERLLAVLGVAVLGLLFAVSAVVVWTQVWRAWRRGKNWSGPTAQADPEDDPNDAVVGLIGRLLLSHPIGATLVGGVCATLAAFCVSQLGAAWSGNTALLDAVIKWFKPLSAIGELLGLSEVTVALILLGIWVIIALLTRNALGAAVTLLLVAAYFLVAVLAWPFGLLDEWLGLGRSILSLL